MLDSLLIAFALAMDCFAVSVVSGVIIRKYEGRTMLSLAFFFGLFQALMPLIGWFLTSRFSAYLQAVDHWIAFGMLAFIGGKMLLDSLRPESGGDDGAMRSLSHKALLLAAVATSIDALAVGVSFAFQEDLKLLPSCLLIGCTTFVISFAGAMLGSRIPGLSGKRAGILGGLVLIGIGLKMLIEGVILK